jgi:hypothetical protein
MLLNCFTAGIRDSVVGILLLGICKLAKDPVLLPRLGRARAEVVGEKASACEARR